MIDLLGDCARTALHCTALHCRCSVDRCPLGSMVERCLPFLHRSAAAVAVAVALPVAGQQPLHSLLRCFAVFFGLLFFFLLCYV